MEASPAELDALIGRLDREPGLFYACETGVDGVHERGGWAFAAPPLAFIVENDRVSALPLDARGAALAKRLPSNDLHAILRALPRDWSLFGVWSGDYRRAVLYLPDELMRIAPDGSLTKERFAFP